MTLYYSDDAVTIYHGDCRDVLPTLEPVDAIVCDPPYGLGFMGKDWDSPGGTGDHSMRRTVEMNTVNTGVSRQGGRQRSGEGFVKRQARDARSQQEWHKTWAREALRVAKPGAHLLAFGGTRTHHRLMVAIEDAGWEIRDVVMWVYGSGFPKSLDVGKAIDKAAGAERKVVGESVHKSGIADSNAGPQSRETDHAWAAGASVAARYQLTAPATDAAREWDGWGTALKPAWEPIIVARKPLADTVAANVQEHGTGALNIDACRVDYQDSADKASATPQGKPTSTGHAGAEPDAGRGLDRSEFARSEQKGRWPANLIHDGSDEVLAGFPQTTSGRFNQAQRKAENRTYGKFNGYADPKQYDGDSGSAARFFYCAKASRAERNAGLDGARRITDDGRQIPIDNPYLRGEALRRNDHPTVKPVALMRYLCRLVTPPGGIVLDPFMGSGSTGLAARREGFRFVGVETEERYCEIAAQRMAQSVMALA